MADIENYSIDIDEADIPKKRPTFLTVLCILSWINVGLALFSYAFSISKSPEEKRAEIELAQSQMKYSPLGDHPFIKSMNESNKYMVEKQIARPWIGYISLLLILIEGVAVYFMFKLRKIGFYLYTAVNVLLVILTASMLMYPSTYSNIILGVTLFFTALFISLYALNLKHFKQ